MKLNPLPRGVTGFSRLDRDLAQAFNVKDFSTASHQVARQIGSKILNVDPHLVARNYFAANLELNGRRIAILCNAYFGYLAFVPEGRTGFTRLQFMNEPTLATAFLAFPPFKALDPNWLDTRVSSDDLVQLSDHEVQQVSYWIKTGFDRIGEVIFNCWD